MVEVGAAGGKIVDVAKRHLRGTHASLALD